MGRSSRFLTACSGGQDVEVAVVDGDGFAGQADEPLDVVHRHAVAERPRAAAGTLLVAGVLEDHHVEAVGRAGSNRS